MLTNHPFPPIVNKKSQAIFLGSFPSLDSFHNSFYYGHKRNQFWKIMEEIFSCHLPNSEDKKNFLLDHKLGVWDVVKTCQRKNSSDSQLQVIEVHDFRAFFSQHPTLQTILFTGQRAYQIYLKNFRHLPIEKIVLPSTSPANTMKYSMKLEIYRETLKQLGLI